MGNNVQTSRNDSAAGATTGMMRKAFQTALGVAETMHQFAVEIPLNLVPESVASKEQTTALKEKHRNLLRTMYGSIGEFGTKAIDAGGEQASRVMGGLSNGAEKPQSADEPPEPQSEAEPPAAGDSER